MHRCAFADLELVMVDQLTGLVVQQRLSATTRFFPPRLGQPLVAGCQGIMGQSTHHRLDRLQIVSVGSLRDQSTTQFHRWRSTNKILSCEVITRMLLGRIFRGHTCEGPPYLDMRVPEWHSCENLAGYR